MLHNYKEIQSTLHVWHIFKPYISSYILYCFFLLSFDVLRFIPKLYRIRIEMVLLKSNVLSEVQRSMLDGGLHVEDLPGDPSSHSGSLSLHLGQDRLPNESLERLKEACLGIGGPAGLWHFIYGRIDLDQYVSSEFPSPISSSSQKKRWHYWYLVSTLYRID